MRVAVFMHRRPSETRRAYEQLIAAARDAGATLVLEPAEAVKHDIDPGPAVVVERSADDVELCVVLGGDGTILTALRRYGPQGVPVFAVNFGEVGFLATVEPQEAAGAFRRAFAGDYDTRALPGLSVIPPEGGERLAMNDISVHRRPGARVARLAYLVGPDEVGRVSCDGLVVATPQGSTGYNLANGGPILAWGVTGYVVSFIAPHSLTARTLVVAPEDDLEVINASREEPVDVHIDGRPVSSLEPGQPVRVRFKPEAALLAQAAGASFYHRLREKFGRLAD